jgi:hypothetical protein
MKESAQGLSAATRTRRGAALGAMLVWLKLYNENWLIQRHGHRSPATVRRELTALRSAA